MSDNWKHKDEGNEDKEEEKKEAMESSPPRRPTNMMQPTVTHPLEEAHSFDTASLIQSAARSVLENSNTTTDDGCGYSSSSPSSNVSATDESYADGLRNNNEALPSSPTLRSLQTKTLPAMPDEQDRKRFVGCLAAALASSYDYDQVDEKDDLAEATRAESMAYFVTEDEDEDEEDDYESSSLYHSSVSGSFDYSVSDAGSGNNTQASSSQRSSTSKLNMRDSKNMTKARARHRKRRYDVLSSLLLSSAELLMLEKGQARAFLPMLSKLLVPQNNQGSSSTKNKPPLWRRSASSQEQVTTETTGTAETDVAHQRIYSAAIHSFSGVDDSQDFLSHQINKIEHLQPFLESMTPGAGFRCLCLFLIQHLLHSQEGYDARIRHAIKALGVLLLVHDMENDPVDIVLATADGITTDRRSPSRRRRRKSSRLSRLDLVTLATRKFESLEHSIAAKLLKLSREQEIRQESGTNSSRRASRNNSKNSLIRQSKGPSRGDVIRGLKIGGTAVVAGTLFAVTGGLAAPGIAAGVAAIAGGTAATAAATAVLTSTAAVTAIFGVGGGGLAAYKMQRRTKGLTEFEFNKETGKQDKPSEQQDDFAEAQLFSTVCLSGWLRDDRDFQRPWGVSPSNPPLTDRLELLERFYSVHSPDHVPKCKKILQSWEGEEQELWNLLRRKYGRDPDNLFPLNEGPRYQGSLTLEQIEVVDGIFIELGYDKTPKNQSQQTTPFERMRLGWKKRIQEPDVKVEADSNGAAAPAPVPLDDSLHGPHAESIAYTCSADVSSVASSGFDSVSTAPSLPVEAKDTSKEERSARKHLATVWDYQANYGGELYTVTWESDLLLELCDSVSDLAFDVVSGGTAQILKHTALSTLMSAIAWPYALVNAANMIDGTWTLAVERADEAGKELARSLLFSRAGKRPVTLIGYSFGARAIYSCLKEIARYQEKWEDYQETCKLPSENGAGPDIRYMREPASVIEDAILMGVPNHLSLSSWKACRQVVAGRLVNCFSQKDLILSLMFQFKRLGLKPVCGTVPVNVPGVENIDVTDLVSGHQDYCLITGDILKRVRHGQPFQSRPTRLLGVQLE